MRESFGALLLWGQGRLKAAGHSGSSASYAQLLQVLAWSCEAEFDAACYLRLAQKSAELLGRSDELAAPQVRERFRRALEDWAAGVPLEYILGFADFAGYSFAVGPGVLIPREDSEVLLHEALLCTEQLLGAERLLSGASCAETSVESEQPEQSKEYKRSCRLLELCCGSFCIGLSCYLMLRQRVPLDCLDPLAGLSLWGSDVSAEALHYARVNRDRLAGGGPVSLVQGDLFAALSGKFDLIVANPPYLSEAECLRRSHWREPRVALAAGPDGLDVLRAIVEQSPAHLHSGGFLLLEAAPWQMHALQLLLEQHGFEQVFLRRDAAGCERVIGARFPLQGGLV